MLSLGWPITAPKVLCCLAAVVFLMPIFLPAYTIPFGFNLYLTWATLCVAAVVADRPFLWAVMCVVPLAMISWGYLQGPPHDAGFGFGRVDQITQFSIAAIVTGATAVLLVVRTAISSRSNVR